MKDVKYLLDNNKKWAREQRLRDASYYKKLASTHAPEFLWIGCSDARVPASQITDTDPGSIFVHRNIANLVIHTDMNLLSVLSYAVEVLNVKHIIVCGHYNCGGIRAAMSKETFGLIDNWLRHIRDTYAAHKRQFSKLRTAREKADLLVELNVKEQVLNLSNTTVIREAWSRRKRPYIHGWVYGLRDGVIRDLDVTVNSERSVSKVFR
jgi:carbonic anhydrase